MMVSLGYALQVCFDELWEWMCGTRHPLDKRIDHAADRARRVALSPSVPASSVATEADTFEAAGGIASAMAAVARLSGKAGEAASSGRVPVALEAVAWDVPTLRREIWRALERSKVGLLAPSPAHMRYLARPPHARIGRRYGL